LVVSRQTLPAFAYIFIGTVMLLTPSIVEHDGFRDQVIVASDGVKAPLDKTIIFVGQETVDGSIGLILNKPLSDSQRAALSPFIKDSGIPVAYGGPMQVSEKIFVLEEKKPETGNGSAVYEVRTWDNAVNEKPDLLDRIRKSVKKGDQHYRVFTGYAAWGPFELESDILVNNNWRPLPAAHGIVFQSDPAAQWDAIDRQEKTPRPVNQS
jgi:putative AlgH/UPF0301 family transcriptional regulator